MGLRNRHRHIDERCFFVTTTCNKWKPLLLFTNAFSLIENSLNFVNEKYHAVLLGYVLMPNHIHLIIYFKSENKLSDFMRDFKKFTSIKIRQLVEESGNEAMLNSLRHKDVKRSFQVWQDRFDDVYLNSKKVLESKLDYIHLNPLQEHWRLVTRPEQYEFSSARFYETGIQTQLKVVDYREFF